MRLFLAIPPSEEIRAALGGYIARNAPRFPGVRWVTEGSLHMTVAFIGEVEDRRIGDLNGALRSVLAGIASFRLGFDHIGAAPRREGRPPDILWAAYAPQPSFARLAGMAFAAAEPFQKESPPRLPPLPHITLARAGERSCPDPETLGPPEGLPDGLEVVECVLYASETGRPVPRYTALDRFPLHDVP